MQAIITVLMQTALEMIDSDRGQIGYHELSKILTSKGYATSRPSVDNGVDVIATKGSSIALIQIKTVIYTGDKLKKNITASGSKNGKLSLRYSGLNLVVLCLDENLNRIYSLVFAPSDIPAVQSLWVPRDPKMLSKYAEYKDNFDDIEFNTFKGPNPNLHDF